MKEPRVRDNITEAERDALRAICQGTPERSVWADAVAILADYRFEDETHQLIFDTLREIRTGDPRTIREQLAARLNNKGFPDLDLDVFFQPHGLSAEQATSLMRALRTTGSGPSRKET